MTLYVNLKFSMHIQIQGYKEQDTTKTIILKIHNTLDKTHKNNSFFQWAI